MVASLRRVRIEFPRPAGSSGSSGSGSSGIGSWAGAAEITVLAGTVDADLTAFPLMIDLSHMPASFWANVRADGGNIRAYAADGTTLIPHDVTAIYPLFQRGRMFVRANLLAASDNTIHIDLLDPATTKLAATDPNGSRAVWADFDAVVTWPGGVNRVDDAVSELNPGATVKTSVGKRLSQVGVGGNQGLHFDGTNYFVTSTNGISKRTAGGSEVASNADPVGDVNSATGETTLNHCGAPTIADGVLLVPVQVYPAGTYNKQYLARFSLTDLSFISATKLTGVDRESSGFFYDSVDDRLYCTDWVNGASIPWFNRTTGAYQGALSLSASITQMQGMTRQGDYFFVASGFGGDNGVVLIETDGTVWGVAIPNQFAGDFESVTAYGGELYTHNDTGVARRWSMQYDKPDWLSALGTVRGWSFPATTGWSQAVSYMPHDKGTLSSGILSQTDNWSTSVRATLALRSASSIEEWNDSDTWLTPSPTLNPAAGEAYRIGNRYDGTTERELFHDGASVGTDAGITAKPGGTTTGWVVGASTSTGSESSVAYMQYAWTRAEVMSDAWMKADADNLLNPRFFYAINGVGGPPVTTSMAGLDTNPPTDAATPGDHASISVPYPGGVTAWTEQAWGVGTYGDATYGTGANPTDYTASEGQMLLWQGIGDNGRYYRASAEIRLPGAPREDLLAHWFDFSDQDAITAPNFTAGTEIESITDAVTASELPRKGPGNGPKISSINGVQAVDFDGGDVMGAAIADSYFQGTDVPYTFAFVLESAETADRLIFTLQGSTGSDYYGVGHNSVAGSYFSRKRDTAGSVSTLSGGTKTSSPTILVITSDGTTATIYVNGALATSGAQNHNLMTNVTRVNIGAFWQGGGTAAANMTGGVGEVVIYRAELSGTDLDDLHTYLSDKWGIALA